ncbi:hypothetical protein K431DRAFT_115360 [Polychaeton citri CBS 116435]|uniref:Uncharacterized protein n=1 Tax=Polychaeton citri CBS 116435 TaxID=1314669 RepID=A0A9P4UQV2_9PEZI|nr:hypothetical protein K431DRAFT_115360 [Polychaeton citri CBS 116435]
MPALALHKENRSSTDLAVPGVRVRWGNPFVPPSYDKANEREKPVVDGISAMPIAVTFPPPPYTMVCPLPTGNYTRYTYTYTHTHTHTHTYSHTHTLTYTYTYTYAYTYT